MLQLSKNLSLPLDFATERIAFLARTGAGKSGGMRVMFEQMFDAGIFSIFIDPKGDAWGIRAAGIGKGKSVLIMGGDYADVPLQATAGKVVAEFLVKERVSTVLDISDFSTPDMWKFVADFTKTLYKLNRDVLHLFIDEADMIAGQQYFDPHCLHGIQLIQNKGRGRGFGVTVATQRPQILNKTVLNASGTLIAMQTIGDDAIKVVKGWFSSAGTKEALDEVLAALPTMQTREAFVYSPQTLGVKPTRIRFNDFQTFDSMRTPKPGESRQAPKSVADIDLKGIQQDMAATIEEAKANDPKLLKGRIAVLEKELSLKNELLENAPQVAAEPENIPVLDEEKLAELNTAVVNLFDEQRRQAKDFVTMVTEALKDFGAPTGPVNEALFALTHAEPKLPKSVTLPPKGLEYHLHGAKVAPPLPVRTPSPSGPVGELAGIHLNIINALAELASFGVTLPNRHQIGFYLGKNLTSGYGSRSVGELKTQGLVDYPQPGVIALTQAGFDHAKDFDVPTSLSEFHDRVRKHLSGLHENIFDYLVGRYPDSVSRAEMGNYLDKNFTSGYGSRTVGELKTAGLVEYPQSGHVKATKMLFPEGLR